MCICLQLLKKDPTQRLGMVRGESDAAAIKASNFFSAGPIFINFAQLEAGIFSPPFKPDVRTCTIF